MLQRYYQSKYALPTPPESAALALTEVDIKLQETAYLVSNLRSKKNAFSETSMEGVKTAVLQTMELCQVRLSETLLRLIERGQVLDRSSDTKRLVEIEAYQAEVEKILVRICLDAGIYTRTKSAYLSTLFCLKKNWENILFSSVVVAASLALLALGFYSANFGQPITSNPAAPNQTLAPEKGIVTTITIE